MEASWAQPCFPQALLPAPQLQPFRSSVAPLTPSQPVLPTPLARAPTAGTLPCPQSCRGAGAELPSTLGRLWWEACCDQSRVWGGPCMGTASLGGAGWGRSCARGSHPFAGLSPHPPARSYRDPQSAEP